MSRADQGHTHSCAPDTQHCQCKSAGARSPAASLAGEGEGDRVWTGGAQRAVFSQTTSCDRPDQHTHREKILGHRRSRQTHVAINREKTDLKKFTTGNRRNI